MKFLKNLGAVLMAPLYILAALDEDYRARKRGKIPQRKTPEEVREQTEWIARHL